MDNARGLSTSAMKFPSFEIFTQRGLPSGFAGHLTRREVVEIRRSLVMKLIVIFGAKGLLESVSDDDACLISVTTKGVLPVADG
jgi:hypothetical protein